MNPLIEMHILAMSYQYLDQGKNYAIVLGEKNGVRKLSFRLGKQEATSIIVELEKLHIPIPLIHEVWVSLCTQNNLEISKVVIHHLQSNRYHTTLYILNAQKQTQTFEIRLSDAIALAIRAQCPIFIHEDILQQVSIAEPHTEQKHVQEMSIQPDEIKKMSTEILQKKLRIFLENEDYLNAAIIRDELKQRT